MTRVEEEERFMWVNSNSSEERRNGVCFCFPRGFPRSKQLPCTDQFPSHHCMHKRRSGPNTSTFLNMKETTPKYLVLVFEVMVMQSQSSLNKQSRLFPAGPTVVARVLVAS